MKDLITLARDAGKAGQSWSHWTASDEVQEIVNARDDLDLGVIEAAFQEGVQAWRLIYWCVVWTTAPADYDSFGTETVEELGDFHGKPLRKVVIDPKHHVYQTSRYGSGLHPSWSSDPRIEEAQAQARHIADDMARAEREAKRAAGLAWVKTATVAELEDFEVYEAHGLRYNDAHAEKARRVEAAKAEAEANEWKRCLDIVKEGMILVDDGEPTRRGQFGNIPGRDPHIYYNVKIVHGWPDDADHANVMSGHSHPYGARDLDNAGSLSGVANWITSGRLRVASNDEIPPRPVVDRIGHDQIRSIARVAVAGRVVWVGRPRFGSEDLVLDEKGHLVRSKKILKAVLG